MIIKFLTMITDHNTYSKTFPNIIIKENDVKEKNHYGIVQLTSNILSL
jgi:hypothetical protein